VPTETRAVPSSLSSPRCFNEAVGSCPRKRASTARARHRFDSFNEAVGSCPRKPQNRTLELRSMLASMRPWARAHGNRDADELPPIPCTGFNEAVGSCPRKHTISTAIAAPEASLQ